MTTIHGSVRLRPTRIGFLVSPTNTNALRKVMQICACLWGGVYNPIIPVSDLLPEVWTERPFHPSNALELTKGYVDFFEPDVFVESEPGLAARLGISDLLLRYGEPRVRPIDAFFEPVQSSHDKIPFGLGILDLYQDLYDREFKFVHRNARRTALFEKGTDHDAFAEAAFGGFPTEGFLAPTARAYCEAFDPVRITPTAASWAKIHDERCATPLLFTAHGLKREHGDVGYPILFVVDPNSSTDLIDFWNLTLIRPFRFTHQPGLGGGVSRLDSQFCDRQSSTATSQSSRSDDPHNGSVRSLHFTRTHRAIHRSEFRPFAGRIVDS